MRMVCIDCGCNITKISSSKSLEKKDIKKANTEEEGEEQEELQKAKILIILGIVFNHTSCNN